MKSICILLFLLPCILSFEGTVDYADQTTWEGICTSGKSQSPINIPKKEDCKEEDDIATIDQVSYNAISGKSVEFAHEYTFRIDATASKSSITVFINGAEYKYNLDNIHFHLNSEHTINGKSYDMEMHLVHTLDESSKKNDPKNKNAYMVIGVIYNKDENAEDDEFIEKCNFDTQAAVSGLSLEQFVSKDKSYYYYHGGLTTPHCDESVNWIVMDTIYKMSKDQFAIFASYIKTHYPNGNNRAVQAVNGRTVYYVSSNYVSFSIFAALIMLFVF